MFTDLLKLQLDLAGARAELGVLLFTGGILKKLAPVADRAAPVITIPGFLASEDSLIRMNRFLGQQGFRARSWGLGKNLGPQGQDWNRHLDDVGDRLMEQVQRLADETSTPVSLVGQSLGGVYARELALRLEEEVDRVIMLGSPTFHPYKHDRHNRVLSTLGYWLNRQSTSEFAGREGMLHWDYDHPALPCVAIHSPLDGIVDEQACHIPGYIVRHNSAKAPRENIRILSSHIGMCVSPWVLLAVADRLVADREHWEPFDPGNYFNGAFGQAAALMYPNAGTLYQEKTASGFAEANR